MLNWIVWNRTDWGIKKIWHEITEKCWYAIKPNQPIDTSLVSDHPLSVRQVTSIMTIILLNTYNTPAGIVKTPAGIINKQIKEIETRKYLKKETESLLTAAKHNVIRIISKSKIIVRNRIACIGYVVMEMK